MTQLDSATTASQAPPAIRSLANGALSHTHGSHLTLDVDARRMRVRSVITTAGIDRAGDSVNPQGLRNRDDYLHNPVVLWAHSRTQFPPIGVCEWLDIQPGRVVAQTKFAQGLQLAEDVFRLLEQGVLRGWSIGFVPRRAYRNPGQKGLRVEEWDLLEYSVVPIPENPAALTLALEKGAVRDAHLAEFLRRRPLRAGRDVLGGLVAKSATA